jgi:hypothetical protein
MAGRTGKASRARSKALSSRRDQALAVVAFVVFVAGIVAWILLSRPDTASSTEAASRSSVASPSTAAPAPTEPAVETPAETAPTPEPAPEPAPSSSSAPAPEPQAPEQVEQSFLTDMGATGMAPPALPEEQVAMARDVCRLMDEGAPFDQMVQALVGIGATAAEADNFVRVATASFCPQHSPA